MTRGKTLPLVLGAQPAAPGVCSRFSFVAVGDALIHFIGAGFNLVSLAINHALDRREKAVLRSLEYWSGKRNVLTAGSYLSQTDRDEMRTVEVNGITCAFLAYTTLTNGLRPPEGKAYYVNVYDPETVSIEVKKARAVADVIIVSMHWGSEYVFTPTKAQTDIAEHLAELGVHIVVGRHPHVVQPVTMVGDTLVIYSLGNFLSAQKELFKLVGLLVSLDVVKTETPEGAKIDLENVTGTLLYNPRRSPLGRYVVVPFDMMTEAIPRTSPESTADSQRTSRRTPPSPSSPLPKVMQPIWAQQAVDSGWRRE